MRFNLESKRCKSVSLSAKRSVFNLVGLAHGVVTEKLRFPYEMVILPPREQLCNRSCSNKHTLLSHVLGPKHERQQRPRNLNSEEFLIGSLSESGETDTERYSAPLCLGLNTKVDI